MGLYPGDRLKYAGEAVTILHITYGPASSMDHAKENALRNDHEGEA